ncbi:triacylglycerol lipase 2 [Glycine max]|uniref:triacylglycerol lipase 2 n=1 Tax=Glycine max TaxID=3847 RepID=UPI0007191C65|nr:triacylglycerol lipase 2 [Glycine max]|eukprot:XP_014621646.1 triacylglycerol lipase 2 [Glycine max]
MANTVVSLFSIVLLCITAAQGRKRLHLNNERLTSYPVINDIDGICKTMVETQGYTCEEHQVTTEDGYILSLQRMPEGRSGEKADKPPSVIIELRQLTCVELFQDASTWLVNSPDESLGFILADNGYDVWLANVRGTQYSSGHTSLIPNDTAYWDWSWDELASYDLPAFAQYVYNYTGQRIHYAGHSLGTLMALAALSQGQVVNMLRSTALLCPIAHMNQIPSLLTKLAADTFIANDMYWLGIHEFNPNGRGGAASKFVEDICNKLNLNCSNLMSLVTGPNCCLNSSRTDISSEPTATKNLIHLSQMIRTGKIVKYDYGDQGQNMQHYGQPVPPLYDMTAIPNEFPLFLSYGGQDFLSDVKDVQVLLNDLKDHNGNKLVVLFKEDYAHLDFVRAVNAKQMIYDPMISFFNVN